LNFNEKADVCDAKRVLYPSIHAMMGLKQSIIYSWVTACILSLTEHCQAKRLLQSSFIHLPTQHHHHIFDEVLPESLNGQTQFRLISLSTTLDGESPAKEDSTSEKENSKLEESADSFSKLVQKAVETLVESDVKDGESEHSYGSASQGMWLNAKAGQELQTLLNRLILQPPLIGNQILEQHYRWVRWMKNAPSPLFLDLTQHIRELITENYKTNSAPWIPSRHLDVIDSSLDQFLSRIACHVLVLPSGSETGPLSLVESNGAHVYGKLLFGGVKRFRLLTSGKGSKVRRVGEQREVLLPSSANGRTNIIQQSHPSWLQLGGIERRYEAIEMGPASVLELTLLPKGWQDLPTVFEKSVIMKENVGDMTLSNAACGWDPSVMLSMSPEESLKEDDNGVDSSFDANDGAINAYRSLEGQQRNDAITSYFQRRVGGLQPQIDAIVRRVLDGRSIYSHRSSANTDSASAIAKAKIEAQELAALGLQPVRGLLLYGLPGTGKTLLVREIAKALGARPPVIVSGSQLLDRWVGGSERLVRELFKEAEEELAMCRLAASSEGEEAAVLNSALHVRLICIFFA